MTNKGKLKQSIEKDINKIENYNQIIEKINKPAFNWKYVLVPVCLILIVSLFILNSNKSAKNSLNYNMATKLDGEIIINEIASSTASEMEGLTSNEKLEEQEIIEPFSMNNVYIPEDLNTKKTYVVYSNDNKISYYIIAYSNNNRYLNITYSKEKYSKYSSMEKTGESSFINDTEVKIFASNNKFITISSYKDYNYVIETLNLEQDELLMFLRSYFI